MMTGDALNGIRVLVAEDEYLLADDARTALLDAGAVVVGPVPTASAARARIEAEQVDAALLDINLRGDMAYDVADVLAARGIPFAFVTGYDRRALPERFADATLLSKPAAPEQLAQFVQGAANRTRG